MKKILVISLLFLNSCTLSSSKKYHWYKSNFSDSEYKMVKYKCLQESSSVYTSSQINPIADAYIKQSQQPAYNGNQRMSNALMSGFGAGIQMSQNLINYNDLLFETCMEAHGFIWSLIED